jgi:putative oxidoreductase
MNQGVAGLTPSQDAGVRSISRLADRIAGMAPVLDLDTVARRIDPPATRPPVPRPSPAVMAALARTDAMTGRAALQAKRPYRRRSLASMLVDGFVAGCALIPYALLALSLRLVMACAFFLGGQNYVEGPRLPIRIPGFDLSVILPLQVKAETVAVFSAQLAALAVPPVFAAYLVSVATFLLPIMLALGLGTRFAALGLLMMTAAMHLYLMPHALWSTHVYWASILMVLVALGPGRLSLDALIRAVSRR